MKEFTKKQKEYLYSNSNISKLKQNRKNQKESPFKGKKWIDCGGHPRGMLGKPNYSLRKRNNDPEWIKKYTEYIMKVNNNPELRKKMFLSRHNRPTKPEKIMINILDKYFPNEWKYVGNGEMIIGGLCPDFININGKKQIIEVFGNYWHTKRADKFTDTEEGRKETFTKYGYKTLIIWDNELKDTNRILERIRELTS